MSNATKLALEAAMQYHQGKKGAALRTLASIDEQELEQDYYDQEAAEAEAEDDYEEYEAASVLTLSQRRALAAIINASETDEADEEYDEEYEDEEEEEDEDEGDGEEKAALGKRAARARQVRGSAHQIRRAR